MPVKMPIFASEKLRGTFRPFLRANIFAAIVPQGGTPHYTSIHIWEK